MGDVIGFALRWPGQARGALWISGDTVLYDEVRQIPRRIGIGTALLHLGGVRFPVTGPIRYTMTAEEAIELCGLVRPRTVIPVHYEGWKHFRAGAQGDRAGVRRRARGVPQQRALAADRHAGRAGGLTDRTSPRRRASQSHVRRDRDRDPRGGRPDGNAAGPPGPEGAGRGPCAVPQRHALHPSGAGAGGRPARALGAARPPRGRGHAGDPARALRPRAGGARGHVAGVRGRRRALQPAAHAARLAAGRRGARGRRRGARGLRGRRAAVRRRPRRRCAQRLGARARRGS